MLDIPVSIAAALVEGIADVLNPFVGGTATALAIVVFTAMVRLLMVPLAVAAARGERTRQRLMLQAQKLQKKYAKDPQRLRREMAALYESEGVSPVAGCLPMFVQMPFFMVMYRLFVSATVAGHQNLLLTHTLLATPLGQNWVGVVGGGLFSPPSLVFLGLFTLLAAVAVWSSRRVTTEGPMGTAARLMPFGTIAVAAFVPLAAGLYLLTSATWTATERALLHRRCIATTQ